MPGPISDSFVGPGEHTPYVPEHCYEFGPKDCPCGHHEGYHNDAGECLHRTSCGCPGLPDDCRSNDDEWISGPRRWPSQLTPELTEILGLMCFQLGGIAHGYQAAGEFVGAGGAALKKRAEDEQAFMLHKLLSLWFKHGAHWTRLAQQDLERIKAVIAAAGTRT